MLIKEESSFGVIPLTFRHNIWEVFLIQHVNGNHWGFPKGRREKGESPKETAIRELKEETGQEIIRFLPLPFLVETYRCQKQGALINKTVQFYIAEVTEKVHLQAAEIIQGKWVKLSDLLTYVTFEEEKQLYLELIQLLNNYF